MKVKSYQKPPHAVLEENQVKEIFRGRRKPDHDQLPLVPLLEFTVSEEEKTKVKTIQEKIDLLYL